MKNFSYPLFLLLLAMTSIQYGSSLAKDLFPLLGPMGATSLRLGMGALILLAFWRPWREKLKKPDYLKIFLYGAALGGMNFFFYLSLERIPLGIAVALEFVGPLSVAIISSKRKLDFLWVLLAFLGLMLLMPESGSNVPLDNLGIAFALISGMFWGLYIIFGQRAAQHISSGTTAAWGMLVAAILVMPFGLFNTEPNLINGKVLWIGFVLALLSSAIPYSLEMFALKSMPRRTFGIFMSLEPALAALMGLIFLKEHLTVLQWLAISLVICASAGSSYTSQGQVQE